jgi:hypothetical protein
MPEPPSAPRLEFAFEARAEVGEPIALGLTPRGDRRMVPIVGGSFEGPSLCGRILPGGADWQVLRPDGVTELHAVYILETDSGARIQVTNRGLRHGPPDVMERLRAGQPVDASQYYFRATPEFETAAPELSWMNRAVFIVTGERHPASVVLWFWKLA